jgi:hypothetical protein
MAAVGMVRLPGGGEVYIPTLRKNAKMGHPICISCSVFPLFGTPLSGISVERYFSGGTFLLRLECGGCLIDLQECLLSIYFK